MPKLRSILAASLALLAAAPLNGDDKKKDETVRQLMQKKLTHSQKVLAGIALNDFDEIAKNAEELMSVSKKTEWKVLKTPTYEMFSNQFRRAAESLGQDAKKKNLDGAALAYVELTLTCVKCHKHVREVREARLPDPQRPAYATARKLRP